MLSKQLMFIQKFLDPLNGAFNWINVLEICFIALFLFVFYRNFIKNTQSEKLVKGLFILVFAGILSEVLLLINLRIIGLFLRSLVLLIALSLIVIFQPELRRFLGYLGQHGFVRRTLFQKKSSGEESTDTDALKEIIEAVKYLTKTKTGALIVFKKAMSNMAYSDIGTLIDAKISSELILTIFHPNTPLHDGAMVIDNFKIQSAGVLLPLTEDPKLSWKYGTRHRAAIGMSEISDAACLVVSEETGDVSICLDGTLKKYEDLTTLKNDLEMILGIKNNEKISMNRKSFFQNLMGKE